MSRKSKIVYNPLDASQEVAWESPLEEDVYLSSPNAVEVSPPEFNSATHTCKWDGSQWVVAEKVIIPEDPGPPTAPEMDPVPAPEPPTDVEDGPEEAFEAGPARLADDPESKLAQYLKDRILAYGFIDQQIEFITENGLVAWQEKVAAIKEKYPKT